jgi:hypothetical protein
LAADWKWKVDMLRVVIESPYAGSIEHNIAYARRCLRHSLDRGEAPFASHLLYTQPLVLDDSVEREHLRGIQAGHEWLATCDLVAFYIDHGWSPGMLRALKVARIFAREVEIRSLHGRESDTLPREAHEVLEAAGIVVEEIDPVAGVRAFRFGRLP